MCETLFNPLKRVFVAMGFPKYPLGKIHSTLLHCLIGRGMVRGSAGVGNTATDQILNGPAFFRPKNFIDARPN